jgi:glycosyltransferase involved in cell wall biosynthesis
MKNTGRSRLRAKILFVHGSADLYGSDITLLQIVSGLDRRLFDAIVAVPYHGPLVPRLEEAGAEVLVVPNLPVIRRQNLTPTGLLRLAGSLLSVVGIARFIRRRSVILVHCNTLAVAPAGIAAKLSGVPQVWHVHEIVARSRAIAATLATLTSVLSNVVVANSRATETFYRRTRVASTTPVEVILNGVDEDRLLGHSGAEVRSLVGAAADEVVFTLVGRINRWKGQPVFLDAAARLLGESKKARFLLAGDSFAGQEEYTEAVDRRIQSSDVLRGRVFRLPHVSEVGSAYAASDVVVVPSTEPESFGLVAAEAMAVGLPVIASRTGALPEIVEEGRTGLLSEPGEADALLTAMKELVASPSLRAEMGRRGRERFERRFRVERYTREFNELYGRLLGESAAPKSDRKG